MNLKMQKNLHAGGWLNKMGGSVRAQGPLMAAFLFAAQFQVLASADSPRERISLNDNWLFTKGDPAGTGDLSHDRKAYNGLALAIIRATKPGTITASADTDGLKAATLRITGLKP